MSELDQGTKRNLTVVVLDENAEIVDNTTGKQDPAAWDREMARLHMYNLICGCIHFVNFITIFTLSYTNTTFQSLVVPMTSIF